MFKEFFIKKMLASQLKDMPKDQQEKIIKVVTENPEIFEKIGKEIQEKTSQGKNQMQVAMEIAKKYQNEIKKLM